MGARGGIAQKTRARRVASISRTPAPAFSLTTDRPNFAHCLATPCFTAAKLAVRRNKPRVRVRALSLSPTQSLSLSHCAAPSAATMRPPFRERVHVNLQISFMLYRGCGTEIERGRERERQRQEKREKERGLVILLGRRSFFNSTHAIDR